MYSKIINNKKITFLNVNIKNGEVPIYNQIIVNNPKKFIRFLKKSNIQARPWYKNFYSGISYYKKINMLKKTKYNSSYFEKIVILPSGPDQKLKDIKKVANLINTY